MKTQPGREVFANVSNDLALSIDNLITHLSAMTDGWPKLIAGTLCYTAGGELRPITSAKELFAYIDGFAACDWRRGGVTKEEFFEGLRQRAKRFDWATGHPHFPALGNVYYTCEFPKAQHTGALDELVDRFEVAGPQDRQLLKALFVTPFWGGPPGKRPAFTITTEPGSDDDRGVGAGKTTVAEMVGKLAGGYISIRHNTSPDRVLAGLLSPEALPYRVALIDNLKSYRFSSELNESLVTCESINGYRLYHGHASRPNFLTTIVTVNGAAYSKDMALRTVVIFLRRPERMPGWHRETTTYIEKNRARILSDIRWHLGRPGKTMGRVDRWEDWCGEVLNRMEKPNALLRKLEERRADIDEDDHDAVEVVDHIRACLQAALPDASLDRASVVIPSLTLAAWVRKLKTTMTDRQVAQYLRHLQSPRLRPYRTSKMRAYMWEGSKADPEAPPYVLTYKVRTDDR